MIYLETTEYKFPDYLVKVPPGRSALCCSVDSRILMNVSRWLSLRKVYEAEPAMGMVEQFHGNTRRWNEGS
jgi:hypothetical protein